MGIPVILGWGSKVKRTGGTFRGHCGECKREVRFYEAVKHEQVRAFLAVSLWDSEEPVAQCGECLAVYEAEHIEALKAPPAPARSSPSLPRASAAKRSPLDEASIDAELAAMKKRLGK